MTGPAAGTGVVIIGAGAGTRFGGPKAVAILPDGRRFLDVIVATARAAGLESIVAVLPPHVTAPEGVRVVANANPKSEQIASIRLGLAQLTNAPVGAALLWPVDHPFVDVRSVVALIDAANHSDAQIVLPVHASRRGHPGLFHRDSWRELMTVPSGGARAVIHSDPLRVLEVPVPDLGVLRDIDLRADLTTD